MSGEFVARYGLLARGIPVPANGQMSHVYEVLTAGQSAHGVEVGESQADIAEEYWRHSGVDGMVYQRERRQLLAASDLRSREPTKMQDGCRAV